MLPWDSEHFGLSIARIVDGGLDEQQAADADRWCAQNGVDCLYLLVAADDAETERVASRHGFRPVDVRLGLRHDLDGLGELPWHSPGPLTVRRANEADLEVLRPLARTSHRSTRFYFDGGFPVDRCDELYARWIERALAEPERELLVAEVEGAPAGYHALRLPGPDPARADLIALDPAHRGRGLGRALLLSTLRLLRDRGASSVKTAMQARNVGPVRGHERAGFVLERVDIWHHKWFSAA